jgi:hypothetical protein
LVIQKSLDSFQSLVFAEIASEQGLNFLKPLYLLDESLLAYGFSGLGDAFAAVSAGRDSISLYVFTFPLFQLRFVIELTFLELPLTEKLLGNPDGVLIYPRRILFFGENNLLLFTATGTMLMVETTNGTIINRFYGHQTAVTDAVAIPQIGSLASVDLSGKLLLWRTESKPVWPTVTREMWKTAPWYTAGSNARRHFEVAYSLKQGRLVES